jgi:hypothetical protein
MAREGFALVRYADDMVVLCRSREDAQKALAAITEWMAEAGHALHPEKIRFVEYDDSGELFRLPGLPVQEKPPREAHPVGEAQEPWQDQFLPQNP